MASQEEGVAGDLGMEALQNAVAKLTFGSETYEPLADGEYDAVVLGTGLNECIMSGLLSVSGLKVLKATQKASQREALKRKQLDKAMARCAQI